jgi:hypothetical protein
LVLIVSAHRAAWKIAAGTSVWMAGVFETAFAGSIDIGLQRPAVEVYKGRIDSQ